ncbi:hypothetical protein [Dyadobacter sp. MSC1_007]|jgi:hypothetical protein|uniref:hypothetical protein n=1 Tax=Dyadobacter sp. MSC1_007 TaxID=2909264 RepID=UPI00202DF39B|nr:hypothetical protein [Dyadobacter sp. MSC1_007]
MEVHHQPKTRSYRYIVYLVLAAIAAGISFYFYSPKPVNKAANKNMALFLQNAISDIDLKLKNGNEGTDLATRLSTLKSNSALYDEAKTNNDKVVKGQREVLKKKMVQIQQREFPELRAAYVDSKKEVLGQQHIDIAVTGENKDVLTFEGEMFAPEKVQKDFMKNIYGIVNDLRFKKVIYKWSDQQNGFADYPISSKNDTEI